MTLRRRPAELAATDRTSSGSDIAPSIALDTRSGNEGQMASTRNTSSVQENMALDSILQSNTVSPSFPPAYTEKSNITIDDWISTGNTILPPAYSELSPQKLHRADRTFSGSSEADDPFLVMTGSSDSTILSTSRTCSFPDNDSLVHSSTATSAYHESTPPSQQDQTSQRRRRKNIFSRAVGGFFRWTIVVPTYGVGENDAGCTVTGDCFVASSYGY